MNTHKNHTNLFEDKNATLEDRKAAIGKFLYELKFRKKEFLNECAKYDFDFSSRIKKIHFEAILNKFSSYLTRIEKDTILSSFVVNDSYVNYIEISNLNILEEYSYQDPLLTHLNNFREKFGLKNTSLSIKKISKVIELNPLDLLNFQISEENFLISISKKIIDYIVTNSNRNKFDDYFYNLAKKFDYDFDDKFAIGEINNFLLNTGINLSDSDLRFLYESLESEEGKISIRNFQNFVFNESKKNYGLVIDTKFMKNQQEIFTREEIKEESRMEKILYSNYFLHIIKESLQVCGKSFLFQFFSKYIEAIDNNFFIDSTWLEVGYKKLGFKVISQEDMGNFKYFLVKNSIGFIKNEMNLKINLEKLFDFLIKEFQLKEENLQFESNLVIKEFTSKILDDMTENILSYGIYKKENKKFSNFVDEYQFRKNIVSSFSFVNHNFLDHLIKILNSENKISFNKEIIKEIEENKQKPFSIESIESRKWLHLVYNFLFMGLINHSDEFGLMFEDYEKNQLKKIFVNLENKIFKKDTNLEKSMKILNIKDCKVAQNEEEKDFMIEPLNLEKSKIEEKPRIIIEPKGNNQNVIKFNVINDACGELFDNHDTKPYSKLNLIKLNANNSKTRIKENYENLERNMNRKVSRGNQNESEIEKKNVNVCDTVNLIPELFEFCINYMKNKYKFDKISTGIISKFGCCQIFRDHLTNTKIDLQREIGFHLFISNLKSTPNISDSLFIFLQLLSSKYKSKDDLINPLYFFSKLEEILIQYSKIN